MHSRILDFEAPKLWKGRSGNCPRSKSLMQTFDFTHVTSWLAVLLPPAPVLPKCHSPSQSNPTRSFRTSRASKSDNNWRFWTAKNNATTYKSSFGLGSWLTDHTSIVQLVDLHHLHRQLVDLFRDLPIRSWFLNSISFADYETLKVLKCSAAFVSTLHFFAAWEQDIWSNFIPDRTFLIF